MSLSTRNGAKQREQDRYRILALLLADDDLTDSLRDAETPLDAVLRERADEIATMVNRLPAADIADAVESLPPDERHALWALVDPDRRGQVLVEASETVWDSLISGMSDKALLHALSTLDIDDQIYLGQYLPRNLMGRLLTSMAPMDRERVREVIRYGKHTVGAMMDFELITVRPDVSLATVQRYLRLRGQIPDNTDKLFVTDRRNRLQGELPLTTVLLHKPETRVSDVMEQDPVTFDPEDNDEAAARTFERDDLVSAAVVDAKGKLMGRLTVAEVVDLVYEESDTDLRRMGGISEEEDVFAPVAKAVKTRWAWLAINLCTAFVASRVIGLFEHTISQLVALAALMPIVAGIGGNTGNQTITMIVRALALQHIQTGNVSFLLWRELGVALINGLVWGGIMGIATFLLYQDAALGGVMTLAMILNLLVAALMGVIIPMTMSRLGRDPAVGASVMITAITDTGGFFIFLGLATLFLL
ncbi:magnesium transporter [Aeromonas taiwanensis]|uniref:Magnesium transporter MgtE n=2 Tax=Aeromonas taiwanensis TaxID=633417 RepID=A0A5F0KGF3_9GAMM|nr:MULTISPECIES: magnesium transporter [Aeromonas]MBP4041992.1 magnesium transporter [Aeromonas sp. SrichE-2G]TFF81281.1 magnesium transporter [Aeromonas taiwanensis]TFF82225.1 magnesium transporter [Aeromonas taiwanensis]TFF83536.1 magnesium transporter [Aeromonas taiwanensis]TNI21308.1 magnesium transporter [Aeromonas dhakensis]